MPRLEGRGQLEAYKYKFVRYKEGFFSNTSYHINVVEEMLGIEVPKELVGDPYGLRHWLSMRWNLEEVDMGKFRVENGVLRIGGCSNGFLIPDIHDTKLMLRVRDETIKRLGVILPGTEVEEDYLL